MTTLTLINASGDDEWAHVCFEALSFKVRVMSSESYRNLLLSQNAVTMGKHGCSVHVMLLSAQSI